MTHGIEWLNRPGTIGESWNPITGCTPVSEGCAHCYARRMAKRLAGRHGYPESPHEFDVTLHPDKLDQPLHWRKPRTVFVCSMSDLFHPDVSDERRAKMLAMPLLCPQHTFMFLTKRPQRMADLLNNKHFLRYIEVVYTINVRRLDLGLPIEPPKWPPKNAWGLVTVENQDRADKRIPWLLKTPFAVRGVSVEPMLGSVDIEHWLGDNFSSLYGGFAPGLSWIIAGAETGPGARPMDLAWARDLRDQCKEAGVPYFFKRPSPSTEMPPDLMVREWPV